MRLPLIITCLLASSCSSHDSASPNGRAIANNDSDIFEAKLVKRRQQDSCQRKVDGKWQDIPWRDCLKFHPPERIHGVWYAVFEEQGFVESPGKARMLIEEDAAAPEFQMWLDIDAAAAMKMAGQPVWAPCIRAVAIDFIGRRPAEKVTDHLYAPSQLIVVDQLLSAKYLGQVNLKGVPDKEQDCSRTPDEMEP